MALKLMVAFGVLGFVSISEGFPQNRHRNFYYPRKFRSIEELSYLPPDGNKHSENNQFADYLPPNYPNLVPPSMEKQIINYVPPGNGETWTVRVGSPDGKARAFASRHGNFASVGTETQNYASNEDVNCFNEKQRAAGGSDVEVDLPRNEPEGYNYPKPTKTFELPNSPALVRTLEQELPTEEGYISTTTELVQNLNESQVTNQPETDRLVRSSQRLSHKVITSPENGPVTIKTLPFQLEPYPFVASPVDAKSSDHQIVSRGTKNRSYQPYLQREYKYIY